MSWYTTFTVAAIAICVGMTVAQEGRLVGLVRSGRKVPEITSTQLRQRQLSYEARRQQAQRYGAQEPVPDFVLVDVRTPEETQVSVIPTP